MTRMLMVTPYAPYRDGIANYAVQEVAALRRDGVDVEVLSPTPSAAHHHLATLGTPQGLVRLIRLARHYDRVVVQYHPGLFFGECRTDRSRRMAWRLLRLLCRVTDVELRIHEIAYDEPAADPDVADLARQALVAAAAVTVHTDPERRRLTEAFGLPATTVTLVEHGSQFAKRCTMDCDQARESLGVPADAFVFVSIGFVQHHKGFDRGVRALGRLRGGDTDRARLYVVGDIRIEHPDLVAYRRALSDLVDQVPGAEFRRGYVSDEEFDRWLVAADRLVLPYRTIWSSSVIERAALYDTPVIATDVGGLADQTEAGSVVVADDDALAQAMADAVGAEVAPARPEGAVPHGRAALQAAVHAAVEDPESEPLQVDRLPGTPRGVIASRIRGYWLVKKVVAILSSWQVEPVAAHLDDTTTAVRRDLHDLERRIAALEDPPS